MTAGRQLKLFFALIFVLGRVDGKLKLTTSGLLPQVSHNPNVLGGARLLDVKVKPNDERLRAISKWALESLDDNWIVKHVLKASVAVVQGQTFEIIVRIQKCPKTKQVRPERPDF